MKLIKVLLTTATVLAAMIVLPATANAAGTSYIRAWSPPGAPSINCPSGYVCLFSLAKQDGTMIAWPAGNYHPNFALIPCDTAHNCNGNSFDNDARSWYNHTGMRYCVSDGPNGGNPDNTMPPGRGADFTSGWGDRASSLSFQGCP